MSLFGNIMIVIFILWTIIAFGLLRASGDASAFMRTSFVMVFIGYITIIVITIVAKKIVSAL